MHLMQEQVYQDIVRHNRALCLAAFRNDDFMQQSARNEVRSKFEVGIVCALAFSPPSDGC